MRNKNLILTLTLIFTSVSMYYLTFTVLNIKIERDADKVSTVNGIIDLNKKKEYLDSIYDKPVKKILWKNFTYKQIKNRALNFGLDLQGGTSIVVDIDIDELIVRSCNKEYRDIVDDALKAIPLNEKADIKKYVKRIKDIIKDNEDPNIFVKCFSNKRNGIDTNSKDEDVESLLIDKIYSSIKKTHEVIISRIDSYGVSQANIQRLGDNRKIQIEIPGTHSKESIKNLLHVGNLKFYETYDTKNIEQLIDSANKIIQEKNYKDKKNDLIKLNSEMVYKSDIIDDIINVVNKKEIKELLPEDLLICRFKKEFIKQDENEKEEKLYLLKTDKNGKEYLNGEVITNTRQSLDENGRPTVIIEMNAIGKKIWAELTGKNINKQIAITFDDEVITAANVASKITDGITQISGNFRNEDAINLATILKTGSLPTSINIVDEIIVGPTLSLNMQKQGLKSILYAFITIFLFMIVFYSKSGLISNIALILNFLFIIGILAQINAVLTLPGIAGLVLTLGMAIDANIIINERIKEEISSGTGIRKAIKLGYNSSMSSIIDSNVTTLLTNIVLYTFGNGPIRGFSLTLIVGIICSFFTSVLFTKYIYYIKEQNKSLKDMKFSWSKNNQDSKKTYNFTRFRHIWYSISALILTLGGIALYKSGGFKYGIEFTGGNNFVVKMSESIDCTKLCDELKSYLKKDVAVKLYGENNMINITTEFNEHDSNIANKKISDAISSVTEFKNIHDSIDANDKTFEIVKNERVESVMASNIKKDLIKSTIIVLLIIFFYIVLRFRKIGYGLSALLTLLHDVLMVFAIYGISKKLGYSIDINQVFVASILTILGYSINNTVIIFDRLRKIIGSNNVSDITTNINNAINKTLGRTIMTSVSTIMVVLIIYIFGGVALQDFSFILLSGFIVGTYSSIFIAAPLLMDFRLKSS